ncbi:Cytochrome P450, family 722, subfamily A, polypeptide 1 isoform 1 [Theobroma cacao]|uniref:Cytochrome P450, family 722, subfamily A, polypeptide 1 isoform 1 n=1 Tax=Theobroma cacao TaxID=3641 RepID=A0A061FD40_THECC|nr:Cytochrome P450, family 722, subfamily A, polypeptide 1 isoform 1 [Theobroma cacao]
MFQLLLDVGPNCHCLYAVLVLAALVFLASQLWKMLQELNQESRADIPPGSLGLPFIGETIQFMAAINSGKGFYDFVRVRSLRYGNCFKTSIFGETHVFVSSTSSAKAILNNDWGRFTKGYIKSIAELVGNQSLLCASQQHHKLLRGRLVNLFSTNSISRLVKQFDELIVHTLSGWEDGGTVIVLDEALQITLKAMCKMLLSLESGLELELLQEDVGHVCKAMLAFPLRLPWTRFYKGLQARKRIMGTLEKIISRRRRGLDAAADDFLQRLLLEDDNSCSDGLHRLSDAEIQDNILTMIIAGQDTTASAITWMVKYLGENEDVLDAIKAEQLHLLDKTSKKLFLTLGDLNEMPYASKVVKESLRMASVVPWFPRLVLQDCEIEGYKMKKGWTVNIDVRSIHLDPMVYSEPNNFNPSRFDDESKPYSFLAFGMGARTCLGMNMAKAMMLVFLHRLLTTYKWKVLDSDSSIDKWALFSRLSSGCPVHVTRL